MSINQLELLAVIRALQALPPSWAGSKLMIASDNSSTIAYTVHQQVRRNSIPTDAITDPSALSTSSISVTDSACQTHPRSPEQAGRFPKQTSPSGRHRVDSSDACMQTSPRSLGLSNTRSDGYVADYTSTSLRIAVPRSQSSGSRCNVLRVDQSGCVHLSSLADDCSGPPEAQAGTLRGNSNHPVLAKPSLVPGSARTTSSTTKSPASTTRSTGHASQPSTSRQRKSSSSARVQTIIEVAIDQDFSEPVSQRIARGRHVATTQNISIPQ